MFKGLQNIYRSTRNGLLRSLVLVAAFMFVSDSFAMPFQSGDDRCATVSCLSATEASRSTDDSHSSEGSIPCSDGDHCHQHHCQTLAVENTSLASFGSPSFSGIEHERVPSSPFLDRVPRPPSA